MTSPKLAVILGAGASTDVCPTPVSVNNEDYHPPVVSKLLTSPPFNALLNQHPEAANVFNDLRVAMSPDALVLEEELRRRWDSTDPHIRYLMRFVPIALQQFFYEVSRAYTFQPVNYSALVARTVGRGVHTAFITLNYDTILEKVLARYRLRELDTFAWQGNEFSFNSIQSYVCYPHWLLVKLHGSVDWGYRWPILGTPRFAALQSEPPPLDRESIEIVPKPLDFSDGPHPFYPALALPLAGKYGFVCPTSHEQALMTFLADCQLFLFVGFSGKDHDLLDLLAATLTHVARFVIVSKGDVEEVKTNICSRVPAFAGVSAFTPTTRAFNHGFSHFVLRGLDELVRDALAHNT